MKKPGSKYHKNLAAIIIILALSGVLIASQLSGILDFIEFKTYDFRINLFTKERLLGMDNRLRTLHPRSQDITLILVEQDCLEWAEKERGWSWPWPREAYAEFLDYMNLGDASAIIFDMMFTEPSRSITAQQAEMITNAAKNQELVEEAFRSGDIRSAMPFVREIFSDVRNLSALKGDVLFSESSKRFGRAVQAVFFSTQTGSVHSWPEDLEKPLFDVTNFGPEISRFNLTGAESNIGAQFPIKEHREAAGAIGTVTGQPDSDNTYRRNRLFAIFDGKAIPGLSAAGFLASGLDGQITFDAKKSQINWGDFTIPVDKEGKTLLRFRGPLHQYPVYQFSNVLKSAADYNKLLETYGEVDYETFFNSVDYYPVLPEDFTGSFVFFGVYAPGLFDICNSPIDSNYPGIGMHITMLDNMLMGDFIQKVPDWVSMIIITASVALLVILVLYSGRISLTVAGLIVSIATILAACLFTFYAGWWIPMAAPVFAVILAYLTATLYSYATEGKDKRFIKSAFSRILSPKVIDQIIADPSQLKLGGERRTMTALFTDIQRFSSISSELQDQYGEEGPKVLVNLLNLYLTEMSNLILANGGTIDKYEGDAIIAFFGAPAFMEDHAAATCRSAIQMKKREQEIKESIMKPEGEFYNPLSKLIANRIIPDDRPLFTRLGINTGDMVVGFMGTPAKMDYTIMGNAVNLAARLEGVNKQYDTRGILISEYTRKFIGDEFVIRPLSRVTVVGIPVPLRLYELLGLSSEAPTEMKEMVGNWEKAFKIYEEKNFADAKKIFSEIRGKDPGDKTAKLYIERCDKFIAAPPPADWDAVDNLTEK